MQKLLGLTLTPHGPSLVLAREPMIPFEDKSRAALSRSLTLLVLKHAATVDIPNEVSTAHQPTNWVPERKQLPKWALYIHSRSVSADKQLMIE